jgi:orotate phosphoribosyltransferase
MMLNKIAEEMLQINAITTSFDNYYTWSSGFKSPIYSDHRMIITSVNFRKYILKQFVTMIKSRFDINDIDIIAGVATAGIPHSAWIASDLNLPMIYVRPTKKGHGKENHIEGTIKEGEKIVVIEDVFTTGSSTIRAVDAIRKNGGDVIGVIGILDYNFIELSDNFRNKNIIYTSLYTFSDILDAAQYHQYFKPNEFENLLTWINNSEKFDHKSINLCM